MMIAIEYLHNNNFIYRDLKPNNVILDHSGTLVLIDLDRMISCGDLIANNEITKDFSLLFAAPEFNYGEVSFASDVYSIGMMIYYIITGNYQKSIINNFDDFPPYFSKLKKKMCERCAQVDPKKRPSISELMDSFHKDYYCDIHIHGLNIPEDESYSQQLSEVNVIETTKNIHSHMFKHNWAFIAEYDNIYSQDCLSQIYLRGLFLPRDIVKFFFIFSK